MHYQSLHRYKAIKLRASSLKSSVEAQEFLYSCLHMNCEIRLKDTYNEIISYILSKLRILYNTIPRNGSRSKSGYMVIPRYEKY